MNSKIHARNSITVFESEKTMRYAERLKYARTRKADTVQNARQIIRHPAAVPENLPGGCNFHDPGLKGKPGKDGKERSRLYHGKALPQSADRAKDRIKTALL